MMTKTRGPVPPVILLLTILGGIGLHYWLPLMPVLDESWYKAGIALIVLGLLVVIGPAAAFRRAATTIIPFHDSSALVVSGMYRYTRNPMYVGMVVILIGVAVLLGDLSPFIMPFVFVPVLTVRVIKHEEKMLEERFGDDYREMKKTVRRWV
ncbi:MAG: isoprenylcysteine carboxylmethyltransferase family protein [Gammaproteobacteria bacterium]|nr:isoprenylcysteine carboxylmethyltransferase family protein [Gammaproteobacteria bacterium]